MLIWKGRKTMDYIRLPLEGTKNTRDLGGYPTKDGKVTKFHMFVRSDNLINITAKDNEFLKDYGIGEIIDFRGNTDIQSTFISDDNINKKYFKFHYIPLSNKEFENYVNESKEKENFNHGIGYIYILKNKTKIRDIFKIFAEARKGVLFHCSAGKDRTGIISSILLGICNVDIKDIIANYEVSNTYNTYPEESADILQKSLPEFIKTFIDNLLKKYSSFENYILSCDIKKEEIEKIKNKFLDNY